MESSAAVVEQLSPRWRIANPIAIVIKVVSHASRGGDFIGQTIAFAVIDPISSIKVIGTVIKVIRTVKKQSSNCCLMP